MGQTGGYSEHVLDFGRKNPQCVGSLHRCVRPPPEFQDMNIVVAHNQGVADSLSTYPLNSGVVYQSDVPQPARLATCCGGGVRGRDKRDARTEEETRLVGRNPSCSTVSSSAGTLSGNQREIALPPKPRRWASTTMCALVVLGSSRGTH